jgi:hypothetical protein
MSLVVYSPEELAKAVQNIRTQFLRDRLAETSWEERGFIGDLLFAEGVIASGGPSGFGGGMAMGMIRHSHPVEIACIQLELKEGVYTPPEEYRKLKTAHEVAKARERADQLRREREGLMQAKRTWLAAGGHE